MNDWLLITSREIKYLAYLFYDANKIDGAPLLHVILSLTQDERLRNGNNEMDIIRNYTGSS